MRKSELIIQLQAIFETSPEYFGEKIVDIWFFPEYRGDRGGFQGNRTFVGSKIVAKLDVKGYSASTEFLISLYNVHHNAGGKKYSSEEFRDLVTQANVIFHLANHNANTELVEKINII